MCIYIYIYIFHIVGAVRRGGAPGDLQGGASRERHRRRCRGCDRGLDVQRGARKGTNGVSTDGVTATFMFFDRGTFWVLPLPYLNIPKGARVHLSPQCVKTHYVCSGPTRVLTPFVRNRGAVGEVVAVFSVEVVTIGCTNDDDDI